MKFPTAGITAQQLEIPEKSLNSNVRMTGIEAAGL